MPENELSLMADTIVDYPVEGGYYRFDESTGKLLDTIMRIVPLRI